MNTRWVTKCGQVIVNINFSTLLNEGPLLATTYPKPACQQTAQFETLRNLISF